MGDAVKLSNKLGVDEHDKGLVATFPNRKRGKSVSAPLSLGDAVAECVLLRESEGRVNARRRLARMISS